MVHRNGEVQDPNLPSKALQKYEKVFEQNTEFFTTFNPDVVEESIEKFLKEQDGFDEATLKINKEKYKMKFILTSKGQDGFVESTPMQVRILEVDNTKNYCVEFTKQGGRWAAFNNHFQELKKYLDFSNDSILEAESVDTSIPKDGEMTGNENKADEQADQIVPSQ